MGKKQRIVWKSYWHPKIKFFIYSVYVFKLKLPEKEVKELQIKITKKAIHLIYVISID